MKNAAMMQVAPSLGYGGLERVVSTLSVALTTRGWSVSVHSPGGVPFEEYLLAHGVPTFRFPAPRPRLDTLLRAAVPLSRDIRRLRPVVIHAHNPAATAATRLATYLAGRPTTPIVSTYHGVSDERLGSAARVLRHTASIIVGCGPGATDELASAGIPIDRVRTVPNGVERSAQVDTGRIRRDLEVGESPLVVSVGRYSEQKNHELALHAFAHVRGEQSNARLVLVGEGPLQHRLGALADELGVAESVVITGPRPDAPAIIAAADVFLLTSNWEAFPLVLLEAMSRGRAVVATRVRGTRDLVDDGVTGLLVEPGSARAVGAAITAVLSNPELGARLGAAASRRVGHEFSVDAMTRQYASIYEQVIGSTYAEDGR